MNMKNGGGAPELSLVPDALSPWRDLANDIIIIVPSLLVSGAPVQHVHVVDGPPAQHRAVKSHAGMKP